MRVLRGDVTYLSSSGGSQATLNEVSDRYCGGAVTLRGRSGTVRYCAVVGAEISGSDTVCTEMLYARPGTRPLKAACAGPGGSPSFSTYSSESRASGGSIDT